MAGNKRIPTAAASLSEALALGRAFWQLTKPRVVALLVRRRIGAPVFFRQERPGLNYQPFMAVKFRTMTEGRDARGELLPDDQRLHPFGAFLRKTSLDGLPQLFNLLKGDVSLVGPRPLLVRYLTRYSPEQARRHDVLWHPPVLFQGKSQVPTSFACHHNGTANAST